MCKSPKCLILQSVPPAAIAFVILLLRALGLLTRKPLAAKATGWCKPGFGLLTILMTATGCRLM